jgi:Na+/H+ antiporter NhaD/arsenite permease-like protein
VVLFPFHIPIYVPRWLSNVLLDALAALRIIPHRQKRPSDYDDADKLKPFVRLRLPLNFVTAPLIADLFLLAILAIGRKEVHDGTIGANNISPLDIMLFFISLAYIAISLDASGLIRYLAFRVLKWGGDVGHRLFFYLYAFFFALTGFIGNDPVILSGTAFLAYMTRVSSNIKHPRAWIHAQFAVANIASAILVSSNPTNLVLAGAFKIKFINYTANIIVPVIVTGIVLFPFLLYIVFPHEDLIPSSIKMHELPVEARDRKPVNPNIPNARGTAEEDEKAAAGDEPGQLLSLEEIMNPFLDKGGAAFGAIIMAVTLITLLAINAASTKNGEHPVFYVTLPAAVVQFTWDIVFGWRNRHETRKIAQDGRREIELARAEREAKAAEEEVRRLAEEEATRDNATSTSVEKQALSQEDGRYSSSNSDSISMMNMESSTQGLGIAVPNGSTEERSAEKTIEETGEQQAEIDTEQQVPQKPHSIKQDRETLVSLVQKRYRWCQETFPTATTVMAHLPFALVPFAFTMFVLVQALVTKGWVPVFAYGWDHWVQKTGTIGAIGGMGFLSVVLCNVSDTPIFIQC